MVLHAPCNASCLSWKVHNNIFSVIGDNIQKQIVPDIAENEHFLFLADETLDMNQTEQLSISIRCVKNDTINEKFLCLVPVSSTSGKNPTTVMLSELRKLGTNLNHLRGQSYNGASNMRRKISGVQAKAKELYSFSNVYSLFQ